MVLEVCENIIIALFIGIPGLETQHRCNDHTTCHSHPTGKFDDLFEVYNSGMATSQGDMSAVNADIVRKQ